MPEVVLTKAQMQKEIEDLEKSFEEAEARQIAIQKDRLALVRRNHAERIEEARRMMNDTGAPVYKSMLFTLYLATARKELAKIISSFSEEQA